MPNALDSRPPEASVTEPDDIRPRTDDGESIFAVVAQLARRASDGQLVVAAAVGIASAAIIGLVRPSWWFIALPLLCIGSFGIWGIAERTTAERISRLGPTFPGQRALAGVRATAAVIGTLAGTLALLAIVARAIGTWKT
jgi:hypothetical protein